MSRIAVCICLAMPCLLGATLVSAPATCSTASAPATRPATPATAPTSSPDRPVIQVECEILKDGKIISHPSLKVISGQDASCEVSNGTLILLGHEIADGIQIHLKPTLAGNAITINGEMAVTYYDDGSSQGGSDGTWILQRGHRWIFEISSTDPDRWYVTPRTVDGHQLRLRAAPTAG